MTKLKILKDIHEDKYMGWIGDPSYFDMIDELKAAVMEWYNLAKDCDCPGVSWNNPDEAIAFNEGIEWFCKHFFNLEDEND